MRKLLPRRPQKSCKGCLVTNRLYEALSDLTDRMARDLEPEQWPEELGKAYETLAAHDAADGSEPEGDGATVLRPDDTGAGWEVGRRPRMAGAGRERL
jgi:hypothetical protein